MDTFEVIQSQNLAAVENIKPPVKEELAANLQKKQALCEKAEALKDSTDWKKTADKLIELQKEWKTVLKIINGVPLFGVIRLKVGVKLSNFYRVFVLSLFFFRVECLIT